MKRFGVCPARFGRRSLLAPALLLTGLAGAAPSGTHTVTLSVGNVKQLALSNAAVTFSFTAADWAAGDTLSAFRAATGGTLSYSTNTTSRVTASVGALPAQLGTLRVQVGAGGFADVPAGGSVNVLSSLPAGAARDLPLNWQAQANLQGPVSGVQSTVTFTIVDN
ncbi:hypothetical protein [Deinococcus planocerae]|uniref:hypothetical protein n=1 Tax=Deinococcus planocerae TaxID=1737569 RepID=UPI0011AED03C|nr:hypothetical protein [Deinococcus planocerae]